MRRFTKDNFNKTQKSKCQNGEKNMNRLCLSFICIESCTFEGPCAGKKKKNRWVQGESDEIMLVYKGQFFYIQKQQNQPQTLL